MVFPLVALQLGLLLTVTLALACSGVSPERKYRFLTGFSKGVARGIVRTFGYQFRVSGEEHLADAFAAGAPFVVVGNHVTFMDMVIATAAVGVFVCVARKDIETWPFMGKIAQEWGGLFVDRSAPHGYTKVITEKARSAGIGETRGPLTLFPEGTTTNGKCVIKFRSGAFVPGLPVLPMTIHTRSGRMNTAWAYPHEGVFQVLRLLLVWDKEIEVEFLPLHRPSPAELASPQDFAWNVQQEVADALGVPASRYWDNRKGFQFYKSRFEVPDLDQKV